MGQHHTNVGSGILIQRTPSVLRVVIGMEVSIRREAGFGGAHCHRVTAGRQLRGSAADKIRWDCSTLILLSGPLRCQSSVHSGESWLVCMPKRKGYTLSSMKQVTTALAATPRGQVMYSTTAGRLTSFRCTGYTACGPTVLIQGDKRPGL